MNQIHEVLKSYMALYLDTPQTTHFETLQLATLQHLVNLIHDVTAMGFGNPHNEFGVLLPMHGCVMTLSNIECSCCFCDLDVGACIL